MWLGVICPVSVCTVLVSGDVAGRYLSSVCLHCAGVWKCGWALSVQCLSALCWCLEMWLGVICPVSVCTVLVSGDVAGRYLSSVCLHCASVWKCGWALSVQCLSALCWCLEMWLGVICPMSACSLLGSGNVAGS